MIVKERKQYVDLGLKQRRYVDWVAGGGTEVDDDGKLVSLTSIDLAAQMGVTRQAIHKYRQIAYFWDIVADRRRELYSQDRMSMLYRAVWAKGLKGDTSAAKLMMQQARVLEAERTDVNVSGTVAVAVVNYSTGVEQKELPGQGKPQLVEVPVPEYIASTTEKKNPDTPYGADTGNVVVKELKVPKPRKQNPPKQQEGTPVVVEEGKPAIHFKGGN